MAFRQGDIERSAQQAEAPLIDAPRSKLTALSYPQVLFAYFLLLLDVKAVQYGFAAV